MRLTRIRGNVLLLIFTLLLSVVASADVFINEVMPNGDEDPESEWIELFNNGTGAVSLEGWTVSLDEGIAIISLNDTIPAKGFVVLTRHFVIFNSTYPGLNGTGKIISYEDIGAFNIDSASSNLSIKNASNNLIDNVTFNVSPSENVSVGRYPDGNGGVVFTLNSLSTLSPLAENDNSEPTFNAWVIPSVDNANISGIVNITVNITDDTTPINSSFITFNSSNFSMTRSESDLLTYLWDTRLNGDGDYNITIYFNDSYGQSGVATLFNVTIDNSAPTAAFNFPLTGSNLSGRVTFLSTLTDNVTGVVFASVRNGTGSPFLFSLLSGDRFSGQWNTSINTALFSDGSTTFTLNATDLVGNSNTTQSVTAIVDNTAPNLPFFISPSNNTNVTGTINITITASDATSGVKFVQVRNGSSPNVISLSILEGNASAGNWTFSLNTATLPNGISNFTINATDFAGNSQSGVYGTLVIDNANPSAVISTPSNGANLRGMINITVAAIDSASGVQSVRVKNGTFGFIPLSLFSGTIFNGDWSVLVDSGPISDGSVTFLVNATDFAGNSNASESITVTIDNTIPLPASIISPRNNSNLSGIVNITITATDATSNVSAVSLRNGTSGNWIPMSFLEGVGGSKNFTFQLDTTTIASGQATFTFNVTDVPGNQNTNAFMTQIIDNVIPTVSFIVPANNSNVTGTFNITVTVSDATAGTQSVKVRNGSANFLPMTLLEGTAANGNWTIQFDASAINGTTDFTINATDFAGNSNLNLFVTQIIDNVKPNPYILLPTNGANVRGLLNITVSVIDGIDWIQPTTGTTTVRVKNGTSGFLAMSLFQGNAINGNWSIMLDTTAIADGSLSLLINATDFAGNSNASESVTITIDNTAPLSASIISPQNNSNLSGIVNITISTFDATSNVSAVSLRNGTSGNWIPMSFFEGVGGSKNFTFQLDTTTIASGQATFTFNVTDVPGNQNVNAFIIETIDNTAPTVSFISPINNSNVSSIINITITATDAVSGVASVKVRNGSGNFISMTLLEGTAANGNWTIQLDSTTIPGGVLTLTVNATDFSSNSNSAIFNAVTVDNIRPSLVILSPQSLSNISGSMNITVAVTDAETGVKTVRVRNGTGNLLSLSLLEGTLANGNWSVVFSTLGSAEGALALSFNATDFQSNANASESLSIIVDNVDPNVNGFLSPLSGASVKGTINLLANVNDTNTGVREVLFVVNSTAVLSSQSGNLWNASFDTRTMPDGRYNITLLTEDHASNDGMGHVVISEAMFNGLGADTSIANEWVELYNPTNVSVNITGWDLRDASGSPVYDIATEVILSPRSSVLIVENATLFNATYGVSQVIADDVFDMTDSAENLTLRDENNLVVDFIAWGNNAAWNITADDNRSIIRNPVTRDTNSPSDFAGNQTATPGSVASPDFITITIDNAAPIVGQFNGFVIEGQNISGARTINVTLTDLATAVSTVQFGIVNNSGIVATLNGTNAAGNFWTAALGSASFGDGTYNITIFANDTAGNQNTTEKISVVIDNSAPLASQLTPSNLTFINSIVNINITATINDSISRINSSSVSFTISGFGFAPTTLDSSLSGALVSYLASGPYANGQNFSVSINARDFAGNLMQTSWSFAVDTVTPKIQGVLINDSDRKTRASDILNISITATNSASGVNAVMLSNGSQVQSLASLGSNVWQIVSSPSSLGCIADGNCTLQINATDAAGNKNATETLSLIIDNSAPAVAVYTINDPDNKVRSAQSILFNATITDTNFDSGSSVLVRNGSQVSLSQQSVLGNDSIWQISTTLTALGCNASLGSCRVTLVSTDIVGNVNSTQVITLLIDDAAPQINAITTNDSNNVVRNSTILSITINATDANTVSSVLINSTPLSQSGDLWSSVNATSALCPSTIDAICVLGITATDNVSNVNSSQILRVSIDHTNPTFIRVNTSDDNGIVSSGDALSFIANVTDAFNLSRVTLNGTALAQSSSSGWNITNTTSQLGCASEGSCTLTFTAEDNAGNTNTQAIGLTVDNTFPIFLTFSKSPSTVFNTVTVTLAASFNDSNGISSVIFEHNATGTKQNATGSVVSATNFTLQILPASLANGAIIGWKAYGIDAAGKINESMAPQVFSVQNRLPTFSAPANITFGKNLNGSINLSTIFSDADSDNLNFSALKPQNITLIISNITKVAILVPDRDFFGAQNITFTAFDGFGSNTTTDILVNVTYSNTFTPIISTMPNFNISEDGFNASVNLSDFVTDGDNVDEEITWTSLGNSSVQVRINQTTKMVNISAAANFNGQETIFFVASDGVFTSSSSNAVVVTVRAVNDAPTASVLVSPSNNTNISSSSLVLDWNAATDVEGDSLTYLVFFSNSTSPAFNTTTADTNATVNNLTKGATYYWKIIASDGQLNGSSSVTSQFTAVNNRAPVSNATIQNVTFIEETADSSINLKNSFSDEDGDSLTFGSSSPSNIAVSINQSTGVVTLTPSANFSGSASITFNATDGTATAASNVLTLTITNVNDAPAITSVSPSSNPTIASQSGSQRFDATFIDVDANDRFNATWFRNSTTLIGTNASNVTLTNLATGNYNITVIVTDSVGATARFSWTLAVSGDISGGSLSSPVLSLNESARQSVTSVQINSSTFGGIDFGSSTLNFSGVSSLDEAFNISRGSISVNSDQFRGLNRSATLVMPGLSFTKVPLLFMASGFESTAGATICPATICTNVRYDTVTGRLEFNVAHFTTFFTQANTTNGAPVITSTATTTAQSGVSYSYDVSASDPDADTLLFTLSSAPSGMSIGSSTGLISWVPSSSQIGTQNITVQASDGTLAGTQSFQIFVTEGPKLVIEDIDVKVDGKSSSNLDNGSIISKEAVPGSKVTFKVKVANAFTDAEDLEIENIEIDITIEDIDDGDDLDEDADEFDLDAGKSNSETISFDIPLQVDEDTYDAIITIEGTDRNGTSHEVEWVLSLEVDKEKHELRILSADPFPASVKCEASVRVPVSIINSGEEDEDETAIEVKSVDLGFSVREEIELDAGTDDNTFQKEFVIPVSRKLAEGSYPIEIATYYETDRVSETKTIYVEKNECVETKAVSQQTPAKAADRPVVTTQQPTIQKPAQQPQKAPAAIKKTSWQQFEESDNYAVLLIISFAMLTLIAVLMVGALFIRIGR